jgi:hypothetical protein
MNIKQRIEEIDAELEELEVPLAPNPQGDTDVLDSGCRSVRWGELEGEKRGLEGLIAA